jgi:hypothetical protein
MFTPILMRSLALKLPVFLQLKDLKVKGLVEDFSQFACLCVLYAKVSDVSVEF